MRKSSSLTLHAPGVESMRSIGAALADAIAAIQLPLNVALAGELGAGKTTLVGAVLNALGFLGHVRSPTYTLIEPYELSGRAIYHLDLYRLADPREVEPLGLRDLQAPRTVFLIEWPERGEGMLPALDMHISIEYATQGGRSITALARSAHGEDVLLALSSLLNP